MGECRSKATELEGNLETAGWEIFEAIGKLGDERKTAAAEILADVRKALAADEHVTALAPALKGAHASAVRLLTKVVPPPDPKPPIVLPPVDLPRGPTPPVTPPRPQGKKIVGQGAKQDLALADARKILADLGGQVKPGQTARVNLNWVIEEGGTS